jgi:tetratricopeptide (TPR) repeat protein
MAVSNLLLHGPKPEEAIPVLRKALNNSQEDVRCLAVDALQRIGNKLLPGEVEKFEQAVASQPNDCALRLLLLGYYFLAASRYESVRKARHRHVLWIIENAPQVVSSGGGLPHIDLVHDWDQQAYQQAKELWLKQVDANKTNVAILTNAARFFILQDQELSEQLFKQAQLLEPNNPELARLLGHLYQLKSHGRKGKSRPEDAVQAFAELEKAFELERDATRQFWMMPELAKAALEAGEFDKARSYATDLLAKAALPDFRGDGEAIHHGNLVLGRLALKAGDIEKAKEHLLKAAHVSSSPVLLSGGPNMMLAKQLLELGERDVVIQYLKLSTSFWRTADHRAEKWIYDIGKGALPKFGANLWY